MWHRHHSREDLAQTGSRLGDSLAFLPACRLGSGIIQRQERPGNTANLDRPVRGKDVVAGPDALALIVMSRSMQSLLPILRICVCSKRAPIMSQMLTVKGPMSSIYHSIMATMETLCPFLDLPLPPSVNRLWRTGRGRVYRSKRYLTWRETAGWELVVQRPVRISGLVTVTIAAGRPIGAGVTSTISAKRCWTCSSPQDHRGRFYGGRITAGWDATVPPGTCAPPSSRRS
jgi:hypothetical protein